MKIKPHVDSGVAAGHALTQTAIELRQRRGLRFAGWTLFELFFVDARRRLPDAASGDIRRRNIKFIAGMSAVLSSVYSGRRIVYLPAFDAQRWVDLAMAEGITQAMVVPTMLGRILDPADLKSQCKNTPFTGLELTGRVVRTLAAGRTIHTS